MKRNYFILTVLFIGAALLLSGCLEPAKYTGGGTLNSAECDGYKANFGFVFDGCGCESIAEARGKFNYIDMAAWDGGVKMNGEIYDILPNNVVWVSYRSTNPRARGEGIAVVTFSDLGEGNGDHGYLTVDVTSGPFSGYENQGLIEGNIQYHECDDD